MAAEHTPTYRYAYGISYLSVGLLGTVANIMESISIYRRSPKTSFDAIVASLSIADGISGVLFMIIGVGIILHTGEISDFQVVRYAVIGLNFSVLASLNHVLLSVMHRAVAAFNKEHLIENWMMFAAFFTLVWGSACLYGVMSVLVITAFIKVNSVIIVAYTGVTILLYAPILYKRRRRQACSALEGEEVVARRSMRGNELTHSVLLTLCSFASYLPFGISILASHRGAAVGTICDMLIALNPLMDALIYSYVNRKGKETGIIEKEASKPLVTITPI